MGGCAACEENALTRVPSSPPALSNYSYDELAILRGMDHEEFQQCVDDATMKPGHAVKLRLALEHDDAPSAASPDPDAVRSFLEGSNLKKFGDVFVEQGYVQQCSIIIFTRFF